MDTEQKEALARINDMSLEATSLRLRAARLAAGFEVQKQFAKAVGIGESALNNAETGQNGPNLKVMGYLFRNHRIDFNFILNGNYSQLPGDVQAVLFEKLAAATNEQGRKERSGRAPTKAKP
jgi:transcriptional regulator with XRE-family HTH domain